MPGYVRWSRAEYQTLIEVASTIPLSPSPRRFQRTLVDAVRGVDAALAARIAGLAGRQIQVLHEHLKWRAAPPPRVRTTTIALSWQEWQAIARVSSLYGLNGDRGCPITFHTFLLNHLIRANRALAEKLARLDPAGVATLYRRVRSGRRWCP